MFTNHTSSRFHKTGIIFFLLTVTLSLYWQTTGHEFLKYDDQIYVTENPHLTGGISLTNIKWAFTSIYGANWHPLTWLSHILDVQLFGLNPAGHHLVSVFFHTANSILLFLLLNRITGAIWRSAVVATLFAVHPLHVESVAWVAERKDVLSTFFAILSLYAYSIYTERPSILRLMAALLTLILGLMAKPMLVTVPFMMLLLDYWPLKRRFNINSNELVKQIFIEKIPFFFIAAASSVITFVAQNKGSAVTTLKDSPLFDRIINSSVSCVNYLIKTLYPLKLSVFYPFPAEPHIWQGLLSFVLIIAISVIAIRQRQRYPYLIIGWVWYLFTLLPVIGIVRVGLQSMADRYTYIPLTGIFIMAVWGISDITKKIKFRPTLLAILSTVIITICGIISYHQISLWRNTSTLFNHAKSVTKDNYIAYFVLGGLLEKEGKSEEALESYNQAVKIAPWYEYAKIQRDIILFNQGRLDAATLRYNEAILLNPTSVSDHISLGIVLALQNRFEEALGNFKTALYLNPLSEEAHYNLAMTLSQMGRIEEAIPHYLKSLEIKPGDVNTLNNLGVSLAKLGRRDEAIECFTEALKQKPDFFDARNNMELARKKTSIKY